MYTPNATAEERTYPHTFNFCLTDAFNAFLICPLLLGKNSLIYFPRAIETGSAWRNPSALWLSFNFLLNLHFFLKALLNTLLCPQLYLWTLFPFTNPLRAPPLYFLGHCCLIWSSFSVVLSHHLVRVLLFNCILFPERSGGKQLNSSSVVLRSSHAPVAVEWSLQQSSESNACKGAHGWRFGFNQVGARSRHGLLWIFPDDSKVQPGLGIWVNTLQTPRNWLIDFDWFASRCGSKFHY